MEAKFPSLEYDSQVVFVSRNLPPLLGGMENLGANLCRVLAKEFRTSIIGPNGCQKYFGGAVVGECGFANLSTFLPCSMVKTLFEVPRKRSAIVFGGSGLMAPTVLLASRYAAGASICYLHGLDIVTPNSIYQSVFLPCIRRLDLLLVNSENTARLAHTNGVADGKVRVLHPCIENRKPNSGIDINSLQEKYSLKNRTILLSVGRLTARKGLQEFILNSLPLVKKSIDNVLLAVVGGEANQAVNRSSGQTELLRSAAEQSGMSDAVRFYGSVDDDTLEEFYRVADLFVFPGISKSGDVEGFGIVAVEAAARGLPSVAFEVGGIPDAVHNGVSGYLIPPGNYERFASAIVRHMLEGRSNSMKSGCMEFAQKFSPDIFATKLIEYCNEVRESRALGNTIGE
ncbi:MAG: glycosyltransferase family 4 protein [Gammaproteobacteria bacterium]|nr:glycosyltransferase family 4 protein [Gammaproteobacteria bacterium]MDH3464987.1 glycosyltransferase family 4 protein [Gammaproteobacteria bacterium]